MLLISTSDTIEMYPYQNWIYRFWPDRPVKHRVNLSAIAKCMPRISTIPVTDRRMSAVTVKYLVNGRSTRRLSVGVLRVRPRNILDNRSRFVDEAGAVLEKRFFPDLIRWLNYLVRPVDGYYVLGGDFDDPATSL